ncbi:DNAJ1, partial [Symbiodinium sp. KB8]
DYQSWKPASADTKLIWMIILLVLVFMVFMCARYVGSNVSETGGWFRLPHLWPRVENLYKEMMRLEQKADNYRKRSQVLDLQAEADSEDPHGQGIPPAPARCRRLALGFLTSARHAPPPIDGPGPLSSAAVWSEAAWSWLAEDFCRSVGQPLEALNVSSSAAEAELRSAYRRQALATHPDKGGTSEAFRLVVEAFEILADPVRRAAYDIQLAKARAAREECLVAGPSGDAKEPPPPAKRTSGEAARSTPKKAKGKNGNATRATPATGPAGKPSYSAEQPAEECKDNATWARELLGLSQPALRVRINSMSLEVLRKLLEFLESVDEIDSDSEELSEEAEPNEPLLAICATANEDDATDEEAHGGEVRDSDLQGRGRKPRRGIWGDKTDGCYTTSVGFEGVAAFSQRSVDLDKIIDMHISLVRMRQRFCEHRASGRSFREALSDAVTEMHSSRAQSQSPPIRIRFRCRRSTSSNKRVDLEELFPIWEASDKVRQDRRERRQHQEQQRQAKKRQREAATRAQKLEFLRQEVQNKLQHLLQKAWGVKALPDGVVPGQAPGFKGAFLCAQLRLQNGSLCTGPPRKDLSLAKSDFRELSILQRRKGDEALRAELHRRELEVMTSFFMSGMVP